MAQGRPRFLTWWLSIWGLTVSGQAPVVAVVSATAATFLGMWHRSNRL